MRKVTLCFLLASSAFGQSQTGPYSVRGTVRNTVSGEAVRNALVTLDPLASPDFPATPAQEVAPPRTKAAISGPGGEFYFDGLPAGHYLCSARKPDFMPEDRSPLNSGDIVLPRTAADGPIQLNLTPYGAIQGRVVNQYGEPVEYVLLVVLSVHASDGEQVTNEVVRLRTNQRGEFLVTRVLPGKYYVKVVGRDGGTETLAGIEKADYAAWESFAPSYFGGARELGSATPIEVAPGSIPRADFRVELQPAFRIRGKLEGFTASAPVTFELLQGDEPAEPQRAIVKGATGDFEILDVLPGTYTLRATQDKKRGELAVSVAGADVREISIALEPGMTVSGTTHLVGASAPPAAAMSGVRPMSPCTARLRDRRRLDEEVVGQLPITGRFQEVFPGEYQVVIRCDGGYPLTGTFGNLNLLANSVITISKGAASTIEITFQAGGGSLKARFAGEKPLEGAFLLVPSFPTLTGPILTPAKPLGVPIFDGPAIFIGLAPGLYSVYGFSTVKDVEFRNTNFLQSLSGGTAVRIEEGKAAEVVIERVFK
jgi:hypothetical protein